MTISELYKSTVNSLSFSESPQFEARCIFNDILGLSMSNILADDKDATISQISSINKCISDRKSGIPLQYILGHWDFYDMTFFVGDGVLIPRPETEMIVDLSLNKFLNVQNPVVYDLCAGTGCIGLTVAKHRKDATVYLFEKEEKAFNYLKRNKEKYGLSNAHIIKCDILSESVNLPKADLLLSNPPYIKTEEIQTLQKEVLFEPVSALDGGKDGLIFYKAILNNWVNQVKSNGAVILECGDNQSDDIINIFKDHVKSHKVYFDFNDIDRCICFII